MKESLHESGPQDFDVVVIGAGPAGCEASLAAATAGANVLCLTINLDMVGYPPATPVLADGRDDRRYGLLDELRALGGNLPLLLENESVASIDDGCGSLVADRRLLGLSWKELLEHSDRLALRQALVTRLEPGPHLKAGRDGWLVTTSLAEEFSAAAVIIAAGTFLNGRILDAGITTPGGRWAEIPSCSLAAQLKQLGVELTEAWARTSPRLSSRNIDPATAENSRLTRDGEQLDELYAYGLETVSDRVSQLGAIQENEGLGQSWMTRGSYAVLHEVLTAEQVGDSLESTCLPGLFFAGRAAGSCNYTEAAVLGLIAGKAAASLALSSKSEKSAAADTGCKVDTSMPRGPENSMVDTSMPRRPKNSMLDSLIDRIVHKQSRPVTVRVDTESGC